MTKVAVLGAGGRMGRMICAGVSAAAGVELVAAVDPFAAGSAVEGVTVSGDIDSVRAAGAEVAIDFTVIDAARDNVRWCAAQGVHAVVGTTGFSEAEIAELATLFEASPANAVIAPNFTIGAVLMMRFSEMAARFFETVEIIEMHHDRKIDAPSGTAMLTAQRIAAADAAWAADPTEKVVAPGARGGRVGGIPVHSVRMRGTFAHQEVLLGTDGQTLTIRHDSYDRTAYLPGILLAVREVASRPGLTFGLDALLGL